ncbi:MAG: hypothetical protein ACRDJS_07075 [Actinomycetota bacterium]
MSEEFTDEDVARLLAWGRMLLGGFALLAPRRFERMWVGDAAEGTLSHMATRGLGGRDVAIGLGILKAMEQGGGVRGWLEAGAVADASDALGTLSAWGALPKWRALFLLVLEVGAACVGMQAAETIDG